MGTVHLRAEILSLDAFTGAVKWSTSVFLCLVSHRFCLSW